ncbi:hypothetical protein [Paraburkholderia caballeronis]|uniref:hypothetical protein n=1 Tax=Paraburkholderia caballeronis TaxID=416943 RepID=UPI0010D5977A|nr:hypothetical protein [Paraburkholderia caballeronis]TDV04641.1 hypothetical protein C7408_1313 [Paraburkholderia caballeronis]TDV07884.1 hypothetical protein C7406_1333 [Paraburkholderia caballeronis]TDV18175.1 hypothetical protein C7404_1313 [Paraburkholderia caballeronis]
MDKKYGGYTADEPQLPDDLNPEVVKATAEFIGNITGLVPPPHNAFPPEWRGYLRAFTGRLNEIARENTALSAPAEAKRGTDAQILFERKLTCEAINGAMAFGYQNTNPPPSDDRWLAPYWKIGRERAEAEATQAVAAVPQSVIDALRFYAHGHHYNIDDDHQQFDTISGEPPNWLHSERDDDCTMIEDGSIARAALCGDLLGWEEPTEPVEGEVLAAVPQTPVAMPFQARVQPWLTECFGPMIAGDREERNHRFFEEATELVQSCGMTASEAHQLVDYTFGRAIGDPAQEVGGVMVTLAALCLANGLDMHAAGETELARISVPETVAKIRAKQAAKPKHSPLPQAPVADAARAEPVAWVRYRSDGGFEGPIMDSDARMCDVRRKSGAWTPLYVAAQQPARASEMPQRDLWELIREINGGGATPIARASEAAEAATNDENRSQAYCDGRNAYGDGLLDPNHYPSTDMSAEEKADFAQGWQDEYDERCDAWLEATAGAPAQQAVTPDLDERALLAAAAWANSNTPVAEALAYRTGFVAGTQQAVTLTDDARDEGVRK